MTGRMSTLSYQFYSIIEHMSMPFDMHGGDTFDSLLVYHTLLTKRRQQCPGFLPPAPHLPPPAFPAFSLSPDDHPCYDCPDSL